MFTEEKIREITKIIEPDSVEELRNDVSDWLDGLNRLLAYRRTKEIRERCVKLLDVLPSDGQPASIVRLIMKLTIGDPDCHAVMHQLLDHMSGGVRPPDPDNREET